MSEPELTLYAESTWVSPWVFHAMTALEEKHLPYRLAMVPLPIPPAPRAELLVHTLVAKVPVLVHGALWLGESLAISEYLAETFPTPGHPRLFPADLRDRGIARQVMGFLRTDLFALRAERPTSTLFGNPTAVPLTPAAQANAEELIRIAARVIAVGRTTMFEHWCIADADLGLALMRLIANGDPVPAALAAYAHAQWERPSAAVYLAPARAAHAAARAT